MTFAYFLARLLLASGLVSAADILYSNQVLYPGQVLTSSDGRFNLNLQGDGNICSWKSTYGGGSPYWCTYSYSSIPQFLAMQSDCNLVAYDSNNNAFWSTGTSGKGNNCILVIQNDANIVVYADSGAAVWHSNSNTSPNRLQMNDRLYPNQGITSPSGQYSLYFQGDGNFCAYENNGKGLAYWCSYATDPYPSLFIMQTDCNAVAYSTSWYPFWNTGTSWRGSNCRMEIHDDQKIAMYDQYNVQIWNCGCDTASLKEDDDIHKADDGFDGEDDIMKDDVIKDDDTDLRLYSISFTTTVEVQGASSSDVSSSSSAQSALLDTMSAAMNRNLLSNQLKLSITASSDQSSTEVLAAAYTATYTMRASRYSPSLDFSYNTLRSEVFEWIEDGEFQTTMQASDPLFASATILGQATFSDYTATAVDDFEIHGDGKGVGFDDFNMEDVFLIVGAVGVMAVISVTVYVVWRRRNSTPEDRASLIALNAL